jgi:glyoxylase-like metal-dependent hydrolase (beta-lactamase superfamily II)
MTSTLWQVGIIEVGVIPALPLSIYVPDADPEQQIDPPCFCYLATNGRETILVDTGPDRPSSLAAGLQIEGDTSAQLLAGLRAFGVDAEQVTAIVHTHLHYDHVQNDLLFPNAVVHLQRTELEWASRPDAGPFYVGVAELVAQLGDRLHLADGDTELYRGMTGLHNGGHTPGHQSVVVQTAQDTVCLCGDIVSLYSNVETPGSVCPDVSETEAFLERARAAGWEMVPSHDPKVREHRWFVEPDVEVRA